MPSARDAAAMEPVSAMASSSAIFPGPILPPEARSRRMLTRTGRAEGSDTKALKPTWAPLSASPWMDGPGLRRYK